MIMAGIALPWACTHCETGRCRLCRTQLARPNCGLKIQVQMSDVAIRGVALGR
jgi:hypothetical protein